VPAPYRAPLPVPPDPYLVAWADLRRRRTLGWYVFGFNFQLILVLLYLIWRIRWAIWDAACGDCFKARLPVPPHLLREADVLHWAVWLVPTAVWLAASIYRWSFRCPHCGWRSPMNRRECDRCGIAIGTPKSAVVEAEKNAADVTGAWRLKHQ
jgi:hypothetical protein